MSSSVSDDILGLCVHIGTKIKDVNNNNNAEYDNLSCGDEINTRIIYNVNN